MSDSEIKLFYAQSSEVKNRILASDEHLRSIDTGAYYVAGPDGKQIGRASCRERV